MFRLVKHLVIQTIIDFERFIGGTDRVIQYLVTSPWNPVNAETPKERN
jgi:hypothetical protein